MVEYKEVKKKKNNEFNIHNTGMGKCIGNITFPSYMVCESLDDPYHYWVFVGKIGSIIQFKELDNGEILLVGGGEFPNEFTDNDITKTINGAYEYLMKYIEASEADDFDDPDDFNPFE